MDYDNITQLHTPFSAVSKIDNATSVVRKRSRDRHRHTSPADIHHEGHSISGEGHDLLACEREIDEQPENLAGLGINGAFRGFTVAPDVIFDEPFAVPSVKPFSRKVQDPIPVHPSPVITAVSGPPPPSVLASSESFGLLPSQPPNVMRSISDESASSPQTAASATGIAIDVGHSSLIQSIGATNKFTHKWPTPKPLSYESQLTKFKDVRSTGLHPNQSPSSALEDGQGLGSGYVGRWSTFKWCLLLSVTTVFAYGTAGLICALMTWFKSQSTFQISVVMLIFFNECFHQHGTKRMLCSLQMETSLS